MLPDFRVRQRDYLLEIARALTQELDQDKLLARILRKEVRPVMAWRKLRLITHQEQYLTSRGPMKVWFDQARAMEAADKRVKDIGGSVRQFQAGQTHHLALDQPIEDHFMGGIVNKYFGQETGPLYWAVWTDGE